MTPADFLLAVEHTPLARAMRGELGGEWLFPIVETLHVISLAMWMDCEVGTTQVSF